MAQKGPKMAQKWYKKGPKRLKMGQNDTKTIPKWPQNYPAWTQKWSKITPKWPNFLPFWSLHDRKNALYSLNQRPAYISKSTAYRDVYSQKGGMSGLELHSELWRRSWFFFWNIGVKKSRNIPFFLVRTPLTDHFGSPFRLEKVPNLHARDLKRLKNSQR